MEQLHQAWVQEEGPGLARKSPGPKSTWWDSLFGQAPSPDDTGPAVARTIPAQPSTWQSKPTGTRTPRLQDSPAMSPRAPPQVFSSVPVNSGSGNGGVAASAPTAGFRTRVATSTSAESITAGIQEGLTSGLSQISGYLQLRRRSWGETAVQDISAPGAPVPPVQDLPVEGDGSGTWQIIWRDHEAADTLQTLTFEASNSTRALVQKMVSTPPEAASKPLTRCPLGRPLAVPRSSDKLQPATRPLQHGHRMMQQASSLKHQPRQQSPDICLRGSS